MYSESERSIYRFHDGERARLGDPLAIEARYVDALASVDPEGLGEQLASPIPEARLAAGRRVLPAVRVAFGVAEFDEDAGTGLPEAETHGLIRAFFAWKDAVRSEFRGLALHVATYGHDPGRPLDYRAFCGLRYNLDRASARQGVQVARGIVAALTGRPHPTLVDAMTEHESGVPWAQLRVDAERSEAEQAAKIAEGKLL